MSGDALFATAPYEEGVGCACCGSREHAMNGCPTGVAADLWTGHEETHDIDNGPDAVAARRAMFAGFGWTR